MKILTEKQADRIISMAVFQLEEYIKQSKINCIVLGISGGIDSAVVGVIGVLVCHNFRDVNHPINRHYSFLDVNSDPQDVQKARELATAFRFDLKEYDLTPWYLASPLLDLIPEKHPRTKIAQGNVKCRLRMISLYHFAQLNGGIVLDTDDLSEEYMGFWTRHGDEGDVKIIQHLTKDEVYDLGEYLRIPESILTSHPGDGLGVSTNNLASDQLGLPYMEIDYIISRFIQNKFKTEGKFGQLEKKKFIKLIKTVSEEIDRPEENILKVLQQSLKTSYKRRFGDNVAHLLPSRTDMKLPELGSEKFNAVYLKAIKKNR